MYIEARVNVRAREDARSEFVRWWWLRWSLNLSSYSVESQVHLVWILVAIRQMQIVFMTDNRLRDYSNCNSNSLDRNLSFKNSW